MGTSAESARRSRRQYFRRRARLEIAPSHLAAEVAEKAFRNLIIVATRGGAPRTPFVSIKKSFPTQIRHKRFWTAEHFSTRFQAGMMHALFPPQSPRENRSLRSPE